MLLSLFNSGFSGKTFVLFQVFHNQYIIISSNGEGRKRKLSGRFNLIYAEARFKPLAFIIDQADEGNGRLADGGSKGGEVVKIFFFAGI